MNKELPPFREEAEEIKRILERISEEGGIPALRWTIKQLADLSPEDEMSAQELAETILEDLGLTSKVLQVVNSFYYNRSEHEVTTVTQAVILLGFDTIRGIALEMAVVTLLSENSSREAVALIAKTLTSAHMVKQISHHMTRGKRVEEAFLAALFHPVARVVLAVHDPDFYKRLKEREERGTEAEKKRVERLLKLTGKELSRQWNFPNTISRHLEGQKPPESRMGAQLNELIHETADLVDLVLEGASIQEIKHRIKEMSERLDVNPRIMEERLKEAIEKTKCLSPAIKKAMVKMRPPVSDTGEKILCATSLQIEGHPPQKSDRVQIPEEEQTLLDLLDENGPMPEGNGLDETYLDLLNQVGDAACACKLSLNQLFLQVVEALHIGLKLDRSLLCLFTPDRTRLIVRHGLGHNAKEFRERFRLSYPVKECPVTRAFKEQEEVVTTWEEIPQAWIPSDDHSRLAEVCISPVVVAKRPIGCFIMDRAIKGLSFSRTDIKKITALRHLLVLATRERGAR